MSERKITLPGFNLTIAESLLATAHSKGVGTEALFTSPLQQSRLGYAPLTGLLSVLTLPIRAVLPPHWPSSLAHLFQRSSQRSQVELIITKWSLIVLSNCSIAECPKQALE